ncbi:MAG: hypothetical protein RIC56_10540 [Pseudomonadales bacterium]
MTQPTQQPAIRTAVHHLATLLALTLPLLLSGCAAMQDVNVGARIPIGGMVDVGMNKTIGRGAPAPAAKKPVERDEPAATKEPAADEEAEGNEGEEQ